MIQKKIMIVLLVAGICLCNSAFAEITYTVTNLNASGAGSFAEAVASSNSDGQDSRIEFSVGGTIHPSARYDLTAGNCTICATTAPSPGITFDCDNARSAFNVTSAGNRFCNIKIINTITNADGITLQGANNVVERCSFDYCRDEAVGITGASARGNVIAYCRIEHCGSQPNDGTNWANGRGILITVGSSATMVGNFIYYCCRGITVNGNFGDIRNCRVENSLSPASGHGVTITGAGIKGNVINCEANNNALAGFRFKTGCTYYRTGLSGTGNPIGLESIDADCINNGSVIVVADTPFPSWLSGATTPTSLNDVGMGTGDCQCYAGGGQTKATNPNPANGSTSVDINANLSWTAGAEASSHDVYFGTNSASPTFMGNQTATTYDPGTMANGTTYYWRIDEVGAQTLTGDLWNFATVSTTPTFVAAGTVASGAAAITPALPAGIATGDILLLSLETANQAISITNQNGGTWTEVTGSPQGTGTAGGTSATRLTVFWSRYNGTQGAPTTSDSGNHQLGRITAFRNVVASGNPWDVTAGGIEATSDTSGAIPGATTTVGDTLIVTIIATDKPDAAGTADFSAWANTNLTSVTERTDNTVNAGNGGGLGIATGIKSTAGAYGNTTVTLANAAVKGMMNIALKH